MQKIKIGLVSDSLTRAALSLECETWNITPLNYYFICKFIRPQFILVESAWQGLYNSWKYKIASYKDYPNRNNHALKKLLDCADFYKIPCIFWNKEDDVHFDRFIDSAKYFRYILTVDSNCINKYKEVVGQSVVIEHMPFAIQQKIHYLKGNNEPLKAANFVGSYNHNIHHKRRQFQDEMFYALEKINLPLDIYDRNSSRKNPCYRFPSLKNITIRPQVDYLKTAEIYQNYLISLNVNTITNSPTMFSRRIIEILASGGNVVTNNSPAIENYFSDFCEIVTSQEDIISSTNKILTSSDSSQHRKKLISASSYIHTNFSWSKNISFILSRLC